MRIRKGNGFTLLELMIVIAVMGIMTTIAIPSYQTFMAQRRLNGAARQVMSDLMAARMKAVSLNQKVKVSFGSNHAYQIWNDADGNGTVADNEGDNIKKDIHPDYYDVTFNPIPGTNPVFQPRGTASNMTIILANSTGTKTITISTAGRVKIG
ncbi:MAG: GspH/FimT family pseudopilin [Proteobacteria bacterium]|nr:GspH/FimT family pseudopilin [Pseudomonadota bacterium]